MVVVVENVLLRGRCLVEDRLAVGKGLRTSLRMAIAQLIV